MIKVDATHGRVQLRDAEGKVWLGPCRAGVQLADGTYISLDDDARPESGVDGLVVKQRKAGGPELRWHFQPHPAEGALGLWLEIHNPTGSALAVVRLEVLVAPDDFVRPDADQPWLAMGPRMLVGFVSEGAPNCQITSGLVASQSVAAILPPGGTLPSELLWLVLDQTPADARASFTSAVKREQGG
ncbi:MAG: hypothetical protein JWM80_6516 [Cyanobacteria bacterium RYN_339]|nr:hypothetical protein [Cyanobacteria bacterium RYN_339]